MTNKEKVSKLHRLFVDELSLQVEAIVFLSLAVGVGGDELLTFNDSRGLWIALENSANKMEKIIEEAISKLNDTGNAIKTLHNVLIEIDIEENCDEPGFLHLETYEKYNIKMAMGLLGDLVDMETYRMAEMFGLENPC